MQNTSIEGDGLIDGVYGLLWSHASSSAALTGDGDSVDSDASRDAAADIVIPDTVVFKYGQASAWYFTGADGSLKRKNKGNLTNLNIEKAFNKRVSKSGVVAYFVLNTPQDDGVIHTTVEYFDRGQLRAFLYRREKPAGILQKFIDCGNEHHTVIQALWSNKLCLLEQRSNRLPLSDTKADLYQRVLTFDGPDHLSYSRPVRGESLPHLIHMAAHAIADRLTAGLRQGATMAATKRVARMAVLFKVDCDHRLLFLWISSLRVASAHPPSVICPPSSSPDKAARDLISTDGRASEAPRRDEGIGLGQEGAARLTVLKSSPLEERCRIGVPQHVRLNGRNALGRTEMRQCPLCRSVVASDSVFELSYQMLIKYDQLREAVPSLRQQMRRETSVRPDNRQVPLLIRQLHPRLHNVDYAKHKEDPLFLLRSASLCEDCYIRISSVELGVPFVPAPPPAPTRPLIHEQPSAGRLRHVAPPLSPERLRDRYKRTRSEIIERARRATDRTRQRGIERPFPSPSRTLSHPQLSAIREEEDQCVGPWTPTGGREPQGESRSTPVPADHKRLGGDQWPLEQKKNRRLPSREGFAYDDGRAMVPPSPITATPRDNDALRKGCLKQGHLLRERRCSRDVWPYLREIIRHEGSSGLATVGRYYRRTQKAKLRTD
ncbi:unnamed protein product [Vitrella brassicaformis CCMP3155]|uniref:Uncharacterized protein n=2 Tax=Vitrella brassicaformis TaxID=1169539 RepID=A0A0G4EWA7_VITBC|nr:unnamed protein product [Vitrella brassicaformis CCMP3155]|eukprot:CEM02323.1 unnamed protein product [Vitrella brassicaformis CCMP3155]